MLTLRRRLISRSFLLNRQYAQIVALGTLLALLFLLLPDSEEISKYFIPAGASVWRGQNPYAILGFFNPPQSLLLLAPLALLPAHLTQAILHYLNFGAFAYVAYRLGASPRAFVAFMLSPFVIGSGFHNLDGLALLGLVLPPVWGIWFILLKPQFGIVVALVWLYDSLRSRDIKSALYTFAPIASVWSASFLIWGLWLFKPQNLTTIWWNLSFFPYLVPVGLALAVHLVRSRNLSLAPLANLCLSPYVGMGSWCAGLLPLLRYDAELFAVVVGLWVIRLAIFFTGS